MEEYLLVNKETGEIESPSNEVATAIRKDKKVYIYNKEQRESYLKHLEEVKEKTTNELNVAMTIKENCGTFSFNIYENLRNKEYLFRFAYLCSISDYSNNIIWGSGEDKRIIKKDIMEILKLSKREYQYTIKYLLENEMVIENEKGFLQVSETYYNRGSVEEKQSLKGSVRMFDKAIQEIYQNSTPREHKKLDLLIRMLPYLNVQHNIICKNPEEKNADEIDLYTLTELTEMFGFSTTQKFRKCLFDITVGEENVMMIASINNIKMIYVNPKVFYKGNDIESLRSIMDAFEIAKNNNKKNKIKRTKRVV